MKQELSREVCGGLAENLGSAGGLLYVGEDISDTPPETTFSSDRSVYIVIRDGCKLKRHQEFPPDTDFTTEMVFVEVQEYGGLTQPEPWDGGSGNG